MTRARMRLALLGAALVPVALVAAGQAQVRPDFTGSYALAAARSALVPQAAALDSALVRIEHREPAFRFRRTFWRGTQADTLVLVLTTDGREVPAQEGEVRSVSTLAWEGDTLVFRDRMEAPWGAATDLVRYWLTDGGRALRAREVFRGAHVSYDNDWVFERRE